MRTPRKEPDRIREEMRIALDGRAMTVGVVCLGCGGHDDFIVIDKARGVGLCGLCTRTPLDVLLDRFLEL